MADELLTVLARFHREVVIPDLERVVDSKLEARITPLRDEMLAGFDAIYQRFDRLETEYQSLTAAVRRLEERMAAVEQKTSWRSGPSFSNCASGSRHSSSASPLSKQSCRTAPTAQPLT